MYEYRDLGGTTRVGIAALSLFLVATGLDGAVKLAILFGTPALGFALPTYGGLDPFEMVTLLATIACWIVVGRWIYRARANAHALSHDMTISPGWAVGWYFVPIANLFKPYQAMREIWYASSFGGEDGPVGLLPLWWALWLAGSVLGRLGSGPGAEAGEASWLDVAGAAVDVVLAAVLI